MGGGEILRMILQESKQYLAENEHRSLEAAISKTQSDGASYTNPYIASNQKRPKTGAPQPKDFRARHRPRDFSEIDQLLLGEEDDQERPDTDQSKAETFAAAAQETIVQKESNDPGSTATFTRSKSSMVPSLNRLSDLQKANGTNAIAEDANESEDDLEFYHANTTEDLSGKNEEGREDQNSSIISGGEFAGNAARRKRKKWAPASIVTPRDVKDEDKKP